MFELNRNPDNYHADVEQVAFSPAKLLLRQAASAIERLEADVARLEAGVVGEGAARQGR